MNLGPHVYFGSISFNTVSDLQMRTHLLDCSICQGMPSRGQAALLAGRAELLSEPQEELTLSAT